MRHNEHYNQFITCQQAKLFSTHEHTSKLLALDHPHSVLEIFVQPAGQISLHHMGIPKQAYFARTRNFGSTFDTILSCITNRYIHDGPKICSIHRKFCVYHNHLSCDIFKKALVVRTRNFGSAPMSSFLICKTAISCKDPKFWVHL